MSNGQYKAMPLSDAEARELEFEMVERLAEAISTTATNFLCTRPERHDERAHLVDLLATLICEGRANSKFVKRHLEVEESLFDPYEYAMAAERQDELPKSAELTRASLKGGAQ